MIEQSSKVIRLPLHLLPRAMSKAAKRGFGTAGSTHQPWMQQAVQATPQVWHDTLEEQAHQLIADGKHAEAEDIYRALISGGTNDHATYGNLAALYGLQGKYNEAIELLKTALLINPGYADGLFNLGLALVKVGRLDAAIDSLSKAVGCDQSYAKAHFQLGQAYQQRGDHDLAIKCYQAALQYSPDLLEARMQLGISLFEQGDFGSAIKAYEKLIRLNPRIPDAYNNLGNALLRYGDQSGALHAFHAALQLRPDYPEAFLNLGNAYKVSADQANATACYQKALGLNPSLAEAWANLGLILKEQGHVDEAIAHYKTALNLKQASPEAYLSLGNILREQGNLPEAVRCFHSCLAIKPDLPEAHLNLGVAQLEQGDPDAAIECFRSALSLRPDYTDALVNYGNALQEKGESRSSLACYFKAIELSPRYAEAHLNLGLAYRNLGRISDCIASYRQALEINPSCPETRTNLGLALLAQGNYKVGWDEYEWRTKLKGDGIRYDLLARCSRWDGSALDAHDQLLVVSEQGLGDSLQFMRYLYVLHKQGLNVRFCCETKLHGLVQSSGLDSSPLSPEEVAGVTTGHWIPLPSLPRHLGITSEQPLATAPYIQAPNNLILKWGRLLQTTKRPIIGINWQGNRQDNLKRGRSIELELFRFLASDPNISFLALQRGPAQEEIQSCSFASRFVSIQSATSAIANSNASRDFLEYAAVVANCDLIITSATTLAHLAGGMGKPTWTLVPAVPDWRWGLEGDSCFWYPSMRLFRQHEPGDWRDVMSHVSVEFHQARKRWLC